MSDSEDEFLSRKKQCQPSIDSENDENNEKHPQSNDSASQSSSQTNDFNSGFITDPVNPPGSSLVNGEKSDQLPSVNHPYSASDSESNTASQSFNKNLSQSSQQDQSSQSSISQSSSVNSVKRKSCSISDGSDSDSSRSTLVSNRSSESQRSGQRLSPDPKSNSRSNNSTLVSNRNLNNTKSSVVDSESDLCLEAERNAQNVSINSTETSSLLRKEKSDHLSDSEKIVQPKAKKYKLLSDDDLSENEGNHSPVRHSSSESDKGNLNSDPVQRLKLKKEKRKKKLQILNELKRMELKKNGNASSDSEGEDHGTLDRRSDSSGVSSDNSAASDSEREKAKSEKKSDRKSLPQRKSKKFDSKLEIKSKTQKMIRENRISLPYHQPKKRSLDEFLARRRNTLSIPLKTTNDVLHVVSEHLLKREKEVEVFYKSESDHSDDNAKNVTIADETANNPIFELQSQGDLQKNLIVVDNDVAPADNNDLDTELENDVEIQVEIKSTNNVTSDLNSCDQELSSNTAEIVSGNCEGIMTDIDVPTAKGDEDVNDQLSNFDTCVTRNEEITEGSNTDLAKLKETNMAEDRLRSLQQESNLIETADEVEENPEMNSVSNLPVTEGTPEPNSIDNVEAISKNLEQNSAKENESEENSLESVSKKPEPPHSDDFDLIIRDSCNDTEESKNDSETVTPEPATDLRSKKLALLSRLNISLRADVKLQASPDTVIELETPSLSELEFGVYELKKKFVFHSSMRNKPVIRKSSTKLSIIRTETDSQGEIINVVKETIDVSCGEVKEDEEKEKFSTPGAKHQNFKENMLKSLIEQKRAKWQEYQKGKPTLCGTQSSDDEEFDEEYCGKSDFEPYHPEDELDDEELEEDDVEIKEKKAGKNDFVDDEAEVSYDEDENPKESDVEDEESEKELETEETVVDEDHESANDEADVEGDDRDEDEDSDAEMLNTKKEKTADLSQPSIEIFKKPLPSKVAPIFKYNTTGTDLENKILGFEKIFEGKSQGSQEVTSSQLFEICSGKFTTQVEKLNSSNQSDTEFFMDSQHGEDSQNINLSLQDTNDGFDASDTHVSDNRSLLFLSDESDTEELFVRKKKLMRLEDSDDETDTPAPVDDTKSDEGENGDDADEPNDEEDADEPNDEEDADEVDALGDDEEELAYNSEEEIVTKQKAAEFFENEAELSESEWGSEDENEQNLDELEKEAGDDDVLDEYELKKELGKIHMRQLLDDDQKDVRMLKEMLLEDGELHSDGKRQRKFQWTNLDDNGFFSKMTNDSDEEVLNEEDEEETEANWRKIRNDREMFISQQEKREDLLMEANDETNDSLPLPKANASNVPAKSNKPNLVKNNNISSPDLKLPFKAQFRCGSFLTRSKMLLDRLALTVGECKENVTGMVKNHRNFVFAAVSPEKKLPNVPETKTEKRKISSKSVMVSKKLKLTSSTNEKGLLAQLALRE